MKYTMKELVIFISFCVLYEVCFTLSCSEAKSKLTVINICSKNVVTHANDILLEVTQLKECQCILSTPNITKSLYLRFDGYKTENSAPSNSDCGVKIVFNFLNSHREYDCDIYRLALYFAGTNILIDTKLRHGHLQEKEGYCIRIQNVYSSIPSMVLKCTNLEASNSIEKDVQGSTPYVYVVIPLSLIILMLIPSIIFLCRKRNSIKYGTNNSAHNTNGSTNPIYDGLDIDTANYVVTTYDSLSAEANCSGTTNPNYTNLDINGLNSKSDIGENSCKSLDRNGSSLETTTERDKDNCSVHNYMDIELDEQYETFENNQDQQNSTSTKETDCYFESMVFKHDDNVKQDRSVAI